MTIKLEGTIVIKSEIAASAEEIQRKVEETIKCNFCQISSLEIKATEEQ